MLDRRLVIIGGKGGVGRTTVAVALGTALARRGRRTLLAHVRCKQRLSQLLGGGEVGEEIVAVEPNLWAVNMNPQAAIREMGIMVLKFRTVYKAVLENRMVRYFLRALPALEEYSMIGKAWYHTTELVSGRPRFDTVVFDGPATGHLVSMLRIPQVILDAVPEGPLTGDARKAREMLSDPEQTCMWITTLAEEMPVSESLDLYRSARSELQIDVDRLVVNALYPAELDEDATLSGALDAVRDGVGDDRDLRHLVASAETLRARRRINREYLDRLAVRLPVPRIELPHLFVPRLDRAAIDQLSERIEAEL
ncbi:MAG: ArsA family ATPase [Deltaproteobacteria bacterium]|nr:ArsA family ATPase [Deltaproteobacteria bacterium]